MTYSDAAYFSTPDHAEAWERGISLDDLADEQEAIEAFMDAYGDTRPDLDPEDREHVAEDDMANLTADEVAHLQWMDDMAAWEGMGA